MLIGMPEGMLDTISGDAFAEERRSYIRQGAASGLIDVLWRHGGRLPLPGQHHFIKGVQQLFAGGIGTRLVGARADP
jgi:hypothetical protein